MHVYIVINVRAGKKLLTVSCLYAELRTVAGCYYEILTPVRSPDTNFDPRELLYE